MKKKKIKMPYDMKTSLLKTFRPKFDHSGPSNKHGGGGQLF